MTQQLRKRRIIITFLSLCLIVLLTFILPFTGNKKPQSPEAVQGKLDLSNWDFAVQGPVSLKGEWELYWNLLLNPSQVRKAAEFKYYHYLPDSWSGQKVADKYLSSNGFATYRLNVTLAPQLSSKLALKIPVIYTSYKLWVNDKLVASRGLVGTESAYSKPYTLPQLAFFDNEDNQVEIVLQVSNFHHNPGGVFTDIYLGSQEQIINQHDKNVQIQMFLFGCLVIMAFYYLGLYTFRSSDKYYLCFAVLCLLCTSRILFVGEVLVVRWFPELDWELAKKIEYIAFHLIIPCFSMFIAKLYPQEVSSKFTSSLLGFSLIFILMDLLFPVRIFSSFKFSYQIIILYSVIYLCYVLIRACLKGRMGAHFSLAGGLILLITILNDLLYYDGMFHLGHDLVTMGLLAFIFAQSINLSLRLAHTFKYNERLGAENAAMLEKIMDLNRNLEERIQERTRELNETIARLNNEIAERKEAEKKLRQYATTDIMTGLLNRATGMTILEKQLELARRKKWPLTIGYLDLDGLKKINDTMGHHVGDELIINTARILSSTMRKSDVISRLGGDEFLIVMPQCGIAEAQKLWQRVLAVFAEFNARNEAYQIKMSYGFAQFNPEEPVTVRELLEEADREMYKMKRDRC